MGSQLLHDVLDVNFHSLLGYEEPFSDVAISVSTGKMLEHLGLPFAQILLTQMLCQTSCDRVGNVLFPGVNLADHFDQLLGRSTLQHVAVGSRIKGPPDINVAVKDGQHADPGAGEFSVDGTHRLNATDIAKFKIQERNVRPMRAKLLDGLAAVGCLGDDQHVRLIVDNGCDPLAELPWQRVTVFGRYSDAPSSLDQRGGILSTSNTQNINYRTQAATLGTTQSLTPTLTNEFRFNYSRSRTDSFVRIDNFGGATPPADSVLYPYPSVAPPGTELLFYAGSGIPILLAGTLGNNLRQQYNVTDNLSGILGAHQLKFGVDYRRLRPEVGLAPYTVQYIFASLSNVLANTVPEALINSRAADVQLIFSSWSLFAQDTWKATRTLTITYGLRWEYNAAPSAGNGNLPFTVNQVNNLGTMTLAPPGTPLWHPQKDDFAPRLGVAWQPLPNLVLRAGAGIFYDLGYAEIANVASSFPYVQSKTILNTSFPLTAANAAPAPFTTAPPVAALAVMDPNHVLPRTMNGTRR